mmetsp:Transcript_47386/g.116104  ORF Transcript_47386/g.116104 Transcript_47386/m.116104 type:complete len:226 (-) Transcript_47386:67-744(-)
MIALAVPVAVLLLATTLAVGAALQRPPLAQSHSVELERVDSRYHYRIARAYSKLKDAEYSVASAVGSGSRVDYGNPAVTVGCHADAPLKYTYQKKRGRCYITTANGTCYPCDDARRCHFGDVGCNYCAYPPCYIPRMLLAYNNSVYKGNCGPSGSTLWEGAVHDGTPMDVYQYSFCMSSSGAPLQFSTSRDGVPQDRFKVVNWQAGEPPRSLWLAPLSCYWCNAA